MAGEKKGAPKHPTLHVATTCRHQIANDAPHPLPCPQIIFSTLIVQPNCCPTPRQQPAFCDPDALPGGKAHDGSPLRKRQFVPVEDVRAAGRRFYLKCSDVTDEEFEKAGLTDAEASSTDLFLAPLLHVFSAFSTPARHVHGCLGFLPRPMVHLACAHQQIIACRLYTGPMFQEYNVVLRSGEKGKYVMTIR